MKNFIAKRVISILVSLRYLLFKLLKYKENNIFTGEASPSIYADCVNEG